MEHNLVDVSNGDAGGILYHISPPCMHACLRLSRVFQPDCPSKMTRSSFLMSPLMLQPTCLSARLSLENDPVEFLDVAFDVAAHEHSLRTGKTIQRQ